MHCFLMDCSYTSLIVIMIIIIMQNLYSAISVSSMVLYNNCNFKKEIHSSYYNSIKNI